MQVQSINAYNNQPSFGAIRFQDGLLNNKNRKAIYDFITGKLNEVDPSDRLKRSFVKRAEDHELDVLFTKGKDKYSLRVDVVSQMALENNNLTISRLNDATHVGTYCIPEQFNIQHFNNIYKSREKLTNFYTRVINGLLCVLIPTAIGLVGYGVKKDLTSAKGKPNTTIVAKDSLKTDSIKPILEDSFKLGKKVIRK